MSADIFLLDLRMITGKETYCILYRLLIQCVLGGFKNEDTPGCFFLPAPTPFRFVGEGQRDSGITAR